MTVEIEAKIIERHYQSPGRARSALAKANLGRKEKSRVSALIDAWERESLPPLVGAEPPSAGSARVPSDEDAGAVETLPLLARATGQFTGVVVNLNARVRAELTLRGLALVYDARARVHVPENLLEKRGVWETQLWEFMAAVGNSCPGVGDEPVTVGNVIVLLPGDELVRMYRSSEGEKKARSPRKTPTPNGANGPGASDEGAPSEPALGGAAAAS